VKRTREDTRAAQSEYMTRNEVSKLLGVAPNTVTRWAREGRIVCPVTPGGHHRFEKAAVERLLATLKRGGGASS
jgi:excisionase family DNA binding protein